MGIDTQAHSLHTPHVKSKFLFSQRRIAVPMKWMWSKVGLRGKFRALVLICFLIWLSNFPIIYFEIHGINQTTLELENCEDLHNPEFEIRRYGKNAGGYFDNRFRLGWISVL